MAETTPLLPRAHTPPHDHPIFLRACHSPWSFLSPKALFAVRAIIASFLSIVFGLDILYGINYTQRGKQLAFEPGNVSLVIQISYYWTTASWTLQHILAPYGRLPPEEQAKGKFLSTKFLVFLTLYNASVTFPFVISFAYWLVLCPSESGTDYEGKGEALHHFVLISITVLNSVIAMVEVMVLSCVRKQKDLATQVTGLIAIYLLYATWTVFGRFITGEYIYKHFDPDYTGWRGLATTDIVILSLTVTVFFAQRGLHELRGFWVWRAKCDRQRH